MGLRFPRNRCEAAFKFVLNEKDICPRAAVQTGQIFLSVSTHAAQHKNAKTNRRLVCHEQEKRGCLRARATPRCVIGACADGARCV